MGVSRGLAVSLCSLLCLLTWPRAASAYSVLAHEAIIDAVWSAQLAPAIKARFPGASESDVRAARAYAYGGSLIQDLGYYPFGSRFFSNLVHYVRSGDFVESLIREARTPDDYAFALGALAHYACDTVGHPIAVNRVVPIVYPKMRQKHGDEVLYAHSPARHVMVEFAFDVLQIARGAFKSDVYQDLVGFEVATPVLERAFRDTYGMDLSSVFGDVDLAIGTYRRAASRIIPDITRVAWRENREEILAANPGLVERDVVYTLTEQEYERRFGTNYRKPGLFARCIVLISKIIPKVGPFRPLAFEPLTPETERMFSESFDRSRDRFASFVRALRTDRLSLSDTDLDTGRPPRPGSNPLADETFTDLLEELAENKFAGLTPRLRAAINDHFATLRARPAGAKASKEDRRTLERLAALNATAGAVR